MKFLLCLLLIFQIVNTLNGEGDGGGDKPAPTAGKTGKESSQEDQEALNAKVSLVNIPIYLKTLTSKNENTKVSQDEISTNGTNPKQKDDDNGNGENDKKRQENESALVKLLNDLLKRLGI